MRSIKSIDDFPLNEGTGSKVKEIMNKLRNIASMKPEMTFSEIMHNAVESSKWGDLTDEKLLKSLQEYELFLQKNS